MLWKSGGPKWRSGGPECGGPQYIGPQCGGPEVRSCSAEVRRFGVAEMQLHFNTPP